MFVRKNGIVLRKIHDTYFLINIKQNYLDDKCRLYEINEIGAFIWNMLDEPKQIENVTQVLLDNLANNLLYEDIFDDVSSFINILVEEKFVEVIDGGN